MSRPPRSPYNSWSPSARFPDGDLRQRHRRHPSLGSIDEEQPPWLDDLLSESGASSKENNTSTSLRRSVSDPVGILEAVDAFHGSLSPLSVMGKDEEGNGGSGFEGSCVYGPNSPKEGRGSDFQSSVVAALLENGMWNRAEGLAGDSVGFFGGVGDDGSGDFGGVGDTDLEKASRRRSGQRSRVRKLQYIAELERNVDNIQALLAELAAQVACVYQQRVALSMENKTLEQQIIILKKEKLIREVQYKSLSNELEKLKMAYGRHRRSRSAASCFEIGGVETGHSGSSSWQMLDMGKLSLGESQFL